MSVLTELLEKLETSLKSAKEEVAEFEKGKKVAAVKVRKFAQESKNLWQSVRVETMNSLKSMPTKTRVTKEK